MHNDRFKFRAWDKEKKKMIYENDSYNNEGCAITLSGKIIFCEDHVLDCGHIYHEKEEDYYKNKYGIMQYTGLKDKNDKDIYEGDIVIGDNKYMCIIKFGMGGFYLSGNNFYNNSCLHLLFKTKDIIGWEVIGNIYEHEHLLKGEDADS